MLVIGQYVWGSLGQGRGTKFGWFTGSIQPLSIPQDSQWGMELVTIQMEGAAGSSLDIDFNLPVAWWQPYYNI